jgi:hypothetical protein
MGRMIDERTERAARALAWAKDLNWDAMKEDWKEELRRQAATALEAADQTWLAPLAEYHLYGQAR